MPCWHIDEKNHSPISVNIQIFLLLEGRNYPQGVGQDITQPLPKLQSWQPFPQKK